MASALAALPERACYLEAGTLYERLPGGSEAGVVLEPTGIPTGAVGLDPPAEIVAYSWAADGASIGILAHGTTSDLFREFVYDWQAKKYKAVSASSEARPATFQDGSPVDPPADESATSPDGGAVATIRPDGDPPTSQVFLTLEGGSAVRIGPEEVRGRACSHVSFSPGGRYVVYDVVKPDGGSEVWATTVGRTDSFLMSANGSRGAWQPYYRPGNTGGSGTGTAGTGRKACPGPFGILGLAGVGAAGGVYRRRRR